MVKRLLQRTPFKLIIDSNKLRKKEFLTQKKSRAFRRYPSQTVEHVVMQ